MKPRIDLTNQITAISNAELNRLSRLAAELKQNPERVEDLKALLRVHIIPNIIEALNNHSQQGQSMAIAMSINFQILAGDTSWLYGATSTTKLASFAKTADVEAIVENIMAWLTQGGTRELLRPYDYRKNYYSATDCITWLYEWSQKPAPLYDYEA